MDLRYVIWEVWKVKCRTPASRLLLEGYILYSSCANFSNWFKRNRNFIDQQILLIWFITCSTPLPMHNLQCFISFGKISGKSIHRMSSDKLYLFLKFPKQTLIVKRLSVLSLSQIKRRSLQDYCHPTFFIGNWLAVDGVSACALSCRKNNSPL